MGEVDLEYGWYHPPMNTVAPGPAVSADSMASSDRKGHKESELKSDRKHGHLGTRGELVIRKLGGDSLILRQKKAHRK